MTGMLLGWSAIFKVNKIAIYVHDISKPFAIYVQIRKKASYLSDNLPAV